MTRVNPDKDEQPAELFNGSETMNAVYGPEGSFLASIRTVRTSTCSRDIGTQQVHNRVILCSLGGLFVHLAHAAQLLLSPKLFGCSDAEDPTRWTLTCAQHPD